MTKSEIHDGDWRDGVFLFKSSIPEEVRQTVTDAFVQWSWLVPGWCQLVAVHWGEGDDHGAAATIHVEYEYRWASVTVYPCWLTLNATDRREAALHEVLHLSTELVYGFTKETIEDLLKEESPKHYQSLEKELRRRNEAATQDLAFLICRKIPPA